MPACIARERGLRSRHATCPADSRPAERACACCAAAPLPPSLLIVSKLCPEYGQTVSGIWTDHEHASGRYPNMPPSCRALMTCPIPSRMSGRHAVTIRIPMCSTDTCPYQPLPFLSLMRAPYMQPISYVRLLAAAVDGRPSSWTGSYICPHGHPYCHAAMRPSDGLL